MKEFTRIQKDGTSDFCYLVSVHDGIVYYGHVIPGHENKAASAVMTVEYFNNLVKIGMIIGIDAIA